MQRVRPADAELQKYFKLANDYFSYLEKYCPELRELFSAKKTEPVVRKYRGSHGGSALFRPIGLEIFARIVARLTKDMRKRVAMAHGLGSRAGVMMSSS